MRRTLPVLMMFTSLGTVSGAVWYVDDSVSASGNGTSLLQAFKAVREGIDAASRGDTVIVAEGTYNENIEFRGPSITLTSTNPDSTSVRNATIIDGNYADTVVRFSGAEDETCLLTGFTIRNGKSSIRAGGIHGVAATGTPATRATIEKNLITGNQGFSGGGLFACLRTIRTPMAR
jgi:hypothetical protein